MAVSDSLFGNPQEYMDYLQVLQGGMQPAQNRPKAVLFGDSMSEYVGYNADGTPNTKYGNSIADVIGNNLGITVTNLATGGETSNEALAGGSKFGSFADYIAQNKPEYAIIRYGAADAIKNKDPNVTLQSIQQMVDIARANGVTPIIVGVSELYGAQNSKTGNIAGYIDPAAEQRANAINAGLAQLASSNGLAFTDVRSAVSAGQGDLLDGVHTNADFGKKMADAISESIVDQGAIQGANVPQLPPNVDSLSNQEKGRLYNQLIDQGYSDAQIRTAAKAESDQDWNALKQIAASVKNTTPETIERRTALEAAPQTQATTPQATQETGLKQVIQELNAEISAENPTVSRVLEDGSRVVSYGDGRFAYYKPGENQYTLYDAAGNLQGFESQRDVRGGVEYTTFNPEGQQIDQFVASNTPGVAGILAPIALTAMGAGYLGPAGAGLLSTPAAAATSAGGMTLFQGGSAEEALRNAALAGLTAYGLEGLMGGGGGETAGAQQALELSLTDDITQLAQQGLSQNQIANIISQGYGVDPFTAAEAVTSALSSVAPTTAQTVNVAGTGLMNPALAPTAISSFATMTSAAPGQSVTVQGNNLPQSPVTVQDLLAALTPAITQTLPTVTGSGTQSVEVPGTRTATTTEDISSSIVPALTPASIPTTTTQTVTQPAETQQVEIPGTRASTTTENIISSIVPALTTAVVPGAAQAVTQSTAPERVEVTAKKDTSLIPSLGAAVTGALPALPAGITAELPKPVQPPDKSLFTPSDILKLIGLLGGAGAGAAMSGTGTGVGTLPPSDTMIGSTTPQFGNDYYAAIQRYYNTYMPQTPRNVATPLQQWYENKFGA